MSRFFTVPDIHGQNDLLQRLLTTLKSDLYCLDLTQDKLIFMGDMIDRGPDSKGVLDTVRQLQKDHPANVVVLKGNHEQMCLDALRTGRLNAVECWMYPSNGGPDTLASFGYGSREHNWRLDAYSLLSSQEKPIPNEYLDWMASLKNFHEEPGFFFSHAPLPKEKNRPVLAQGQPFTDYELTWTYFENEQHHSRHIKDADGKVIVGVCGHIHRLGRNLFCPRYYENYLFLDAGSGCYSKAPLVCTEVKSRTPIAIWPLGQDPIGHQTRGYIHPSFWAATAEEKKKAEEKPVVVPPFHN